MNDRMRVLLLRGGAGFILGLHGLVSVGLLLQGVKTVRGAIIGADYWYGAIIGFLGFIFLLMMGDTWRRVRSATFLEKMSVWRTGVGIRKTGVSAAIFVLLVVFQHQLHTMLLYVGFTAGSFFIHSATLAYSWFPGVDLANTSLHLFAWAYQWYFIDFIVRGIWGFVENKRKKK